MTKQEKELVNEMVKHLKKEFSAMQFHTGRAWFDFDAAIDRCKELTDKVASEMKNN